MNDANEDLTTRVSVAQPGAAGASLPKEPCLIVLSGGLAGQLVRLDGCAPVVVGRLPQARLRFDDRSVSRQHARLTNDPHAGVTLEDLGSTNGTFVNGRRVERCLLDDGDRINFGPEHLVKFAFQDALEQTAQEELFVRGIKDGLTGVYNKQYLHDRLEAEWHHARRNRGDLALLVLDVDHFKRINDGHGHPAGDLILRTLTAILGSLLRAEDVFARYGGDEFVLLGRGLGPAGAVVLAERMRGALARHAFVWNGERIPLTVSIGIGTLDDEPRKAADLIRLADKHLYRAKRAGRDRVAGGPRVMAALESLIIARREHAG